MVGPVTRDGILSAEARVQERFAWLWQPLGGRGRPSRCAAREAPVRITRLRMSQFLIHEQVSYRYAMTPNSIAIPSVHMLQASGGGEFSRPAIFPDPSATVVPLVSTREFREVLN